ncbi:MAG: flagellar hook capping FlgD N-terminal domain-containing protein [Actinomycetota bacterium]
MSDIGISTLGANPVDTSFQSEALANLDKDAFLQLLVAQMKYQNPLSPVDSNEYLAQAAQYASVEQLENMAQSQSELRSMQMVSIATDLVGKEVTAIDPLTGGEVTGVVEAVRFGAEPILVVNGVDVGLTGVIDVRAGDPAPPVTTPGPTEPETAVADPDPEPDTTVAAPESDTEPAPAEDTTDPAADEAPVAAA